MNSRTKNTLIYVMIAILITSCNLPVADSVPPPSDVQTAAAMTVEALMALPTSTIEQVATPVDKTPSPIPAFTATITPTYSTPMLTVLEQTNCREGPGQDYEVVFTYLQNKKLEILGRYGTNNYWLVKSSESPSGECWLWGEYVEVTGSYWVVPSLTPPPTATPSLPAAPSLQKWDFYCNLANNQLEVSIKWTDKANNEAGYRVIRDNTFIIELPANSTSFNETIDFSSGDSVSYIIEVYNVTGFARSSVVNWSC